MLSLTGCCIYKMPTEDYVATNPVTNNPQLTNEKPSLPGKNL